MSHTDQHNHLTSAEKLDTSNYSHVVSVRADRVEAWKAKGYVVISDSGDSSLMGDPKRSNPELDEKL